MRRRAWLALGALGACSVAAPRFVRHAQAADTPRFELGVASGHPQPGGMVLWTMLTGAGLPPGADVLWEVAEDEAFTRIAARGREAAIEAEHHSVHAEPGGLQPARVYWYRFSALGQQSPVGRTRTAPAPDAVVPQLDFVIASCQRFDVGHYAAWRHAAAEPLDLVVFLGDYIYEYGSRAGALRPHEDGPVRTLAGYRRRYAQYKRDPALQAAHAACPWLLTWDDHEVDNDYAALQGPLRGFGFAAQRAAAYQAWWEHMPVPKASKPRDGHLRVYGHADWGRLARFLVLDGRQHRDAQACQPPLLGGSRRVALADCPELLDPRRTLLGAAQERWLAESWSTDRPWNLLAQQTLMARQRWPGAPAPDDSADAVRDSDVDTATYWTDGWDGYAPARRRLLDVVAGKRLPGAVVLGGDVHAHHVADLKADFDDPRSAVVASEFCGTSISSEGRSQARLDAARAANPHLHWSRSDQRGYIRFTLREQALQAELMGLADATRPDSSITTQARFVVEAGRPGPQRA